jgi:acyl-CoA thioester hydrolase
MCVLMTLYPVIQLIETTYIVPFSRHHSVSFYKRLFVLTMPAFIWPVRVYYEDTDAGGLVYHANYLNFFERARTEWLRHHGIEQDSLRQEHHVLFVVRSMCVDYHKPAQFNQMLHVDVSVMNYGRASLNIKQEIHHHQRILASAEVRLACIHSHSLRPQALPLILVDLLKRTYSP